MEPGTKNTPDEAPTQDEVSVVDAEYIFLLIEQRQISIYPDIG